MTSDHKRVLFVCIGNACRSQMAEAFARHHGSDVLIAASAGLAPAAFVMPDTIRAMREKNLDLRDHFPKSLGYLNRAQFDLVVNMSGHDLPEDLTVPVVEWDVMDPVALAYSEHCEVRDAIERMVLKLIEDTRDERRKPHFRGQGSGQIPL